MTETLSWDRKIFQKPDDSQCAALLIIQSVVCFNIQEIATKIIFQALQRLLRCPLAISTNCGQFTTRLTCA